MKIGIPKEIKNNEFRSANFDLASLHFGVDKSLGSCQNLSGNLNDVFVMERLNELEEIVIGGRVKDRLSLPVAIAQIDKEDAAVVARRIHPSRDRHDLAHVVAAQFAAGICSIHR